MSGSPCWDLWTVEGSHPGTNKKTKECYLMLKETDDTAIDTIFCIFYLIFMVQNTLTLTCVKKHSHLYEDS